MVQNRRKCREYGDIPIKLFPSKPKAYPSTGPYILSYLHMLKSKGDPNFHPFWTWTVSKCPLPRNKFSEPETGANLLSHSRHFLHKSKRGKGAFCCASPFTVQPDLSLFLRQKCAHPNMLLKIMKEKESIRRFVFSWRKLQKVQGEKIDNQDILALPLSSVLYPPSLKGQAHEMNDFLNWISRYFQCGAHGF